MHPPTHVLGSSCSTCSNDQPCCTNVDLNPLLILQGDLKSYGERNVEPWTDRTYRAVPKRNGDCVHFVSGQCNLGSKRPTVCRTYPLLYDGQRWILDAQCPAAAITMFRAALSGSEESEFIRRAIMRLRAAGPDLTEPVRQITYNWRYVLTVDESTFPKSLR